MHRDSVVAAEVLGRIVLAAFEVGLVASYSFGCTAPSVVKDMVVAHPGDSRLASTYWGCCIMEMLEVVLPVVGTVLPVRPQSMVSGELNALGLYELALEPVQLGLVACLMPQPAAVAEYPAQVTD